MSLGKRGNNSKCPKCGVEFKWGLVENYVTVINLTFHTQKTKHDIKLCNYEKFIITNEYI